MVLLRADSTRRIKTIPGALESLIVAAEPTFFGAERVLLADATYAQWLWFFYQTVAKLQLMVSFAP